MKPYQGRNNCQSLSVVDTQHGQYVREISRNGSHTHANFLKVWYGEQLIRKAISLKEMALCVKYAFLKDFAKIH